MPVYSVFGGLLHSDVAFQGLRPTRGVARDWTFRLDRAARIPARSTVVGRQRVSPQLEIVLSRAPDDSFVLSYSAYGLGDFVISPDGSEIVWRPGEEPWMDAVRWVLLGKVMATAMYASGTLCVHGSAVSLDGEGFCFLAPKGHGKSTLAGALVAAGARLATDDVLPVDVGPPVRMRPGVPVLRLMQDSERAVDLGGRGDGRSGHDAGKARIDFSSAEDLVGAPEPLRAIYVLAPARTEPEPGRAATRQRLEGVSALELLVQHSSVASLMSPAEARLLFTQAAAIARAVPVYLLRSIRDLGRLPEVVAQLREWHGRPAPVSVAAPR